MHAVVSMQLTRARGGDYRMKRPLTVPPAPLTPPTHPPHSSRRFRILTKCSHQMSLDPLRPRRTINLVRSSRKTTSPMLSIPTKGYGTRGLSAGALSLPILWWLFACCIFVPSLGQCAMLTRGDNRYCSCLEGLLLTSGGSVWASFLLLQQIAAARTDAC
jgi:hypothetical protein